MLDNQDSEGGADKQHSQSHILCQFSSPHSVWKFFKKSIRTANVSMNNGVWLD